MKLLLGDCLGVIKGLDDNSVDAVVTDPPYELGFMGKKWDSSGIAYDKNLWKEVLRVLKPGGHLLSFGGGRTYHRMACAIDDAGFEIRDQIMWVYGSGFPKSMNIGKAVDKLQGNEREITGTAIRSEGRAFAEGASGFAKGEITLTKGTSEWEGYGTALKPAHEPIVMARKPLEGTVAENCLKWGVGGLNIDGCRVEAHDGTTTARKKCEVKDTSAPFGKGYEMGGNGSPLGRFPANLIHDNSEEVRECFPETKSVSIKGGANRKAYQQKEVINPSGGKEVNRVRKDEGYDDSGNASRFFKSIIYQAKASKSERNRGCEDMPLKHYLKENKMGGEGDTMLTGSGNPRDCRKHNNHPTVKPLALMKYLVKLVSREGHTVLDPFMGSGTTGIACKELGREFIGIEMSPEYMEIAKRRIEGAKPVEKELFDEGEVSV